MSKRSSHPIHPALRHREHTKVCIRRDSLVLGRAYGCDGVLVRVDDARGHFLDYRRTLAQAAETIRAAAAVALAFGEA